MKLTEFEKQFGNIETGFLIRKFEERRDRNTLINTVKISFRDKGLKLVDASEKTLNSETWGNIKEYMDGCSFGVVIIDDFSPSDTNEFNPNVFLEIGYLLSLKKNIFILIQNSLERKLPTDVKPFLYTTFDYQDIDSSELKSRIYRWISNIKSEPGYLTVYFKKGYVGIDFISEFKQLLLSVSECEVISDKAINIDKTQIKRLKLKGSQEVAKVMFKTCSYSAAKNFEQDFEKDRYKYAERITNSILKFDVDKFPDDVNEDPMQPGIYYLLNNEKESLVCCTRDSIEDCEEEIEYSKRFFSKKATFSSSEIEIVILKALKSSGYIYSTNYKHSPNGSPLKMYHGRKKDDLPCLPLNMADILFMTIYGAIPHPDELRNNTDFRKKYLKTVDLHIDKVKYIIQEPGTPIEYGLARNIQTFER